MAEGKNSFVLYKDIIHTVKKLPKEKQADLFVTILEYVNDENPVVEDPYVDLVFEPIKQSLKRDLKKYESICERNSKNGKKGGRPPKPKKPIGLNENPPVNGKPKKADSDSDIESDKDILYTEKEFLEDWAKCRKSFRNLPTNIKRLGTQDKIKLEQALKDFSKDEVREAMRGLFGQEQINFSAMITQPTHFLERVEMYLNAFQSKDFKLYGSKPVEH